MTTIICHNDGDGYCAGAIALQVHPESDVIPIDYSDTFPMDTIEPNEIVYILDFNLDSVETLEELLKITTNVTLIDHHKSSIGKFDDIDTSKMNNLIINTNHAGCVLTWKYFYSDKKIPRAVLLIEDMDIWKWEFGIETENFIAGFDIEDKNPKTNPELWNILLDNRKSKRLIKDLSKAGVIVNKYNKNMSKTIVEDIGFDYEWEGYNCYVVNRSRVNSKLFDTVWGNYDVYIAYAYTGSTHRISLYSDTVDVSVLAKRHGGGGHKGASGFQSVNNPFITGDLQTRSADEMKDCLSEVLDSVKETSKRFAENYDLVNYVEYVMDLGAHIGLMYGMMWCLNEVDEVGDLKTMRSEIVKKFGDRFMTLNDGLDAKTVEDKRGDDE